MVVLDPSQQTICEDLKAFERRLTEVISNLGPATNRWRITLVVVFFCVLIGAYQWLFDPDTATLPFIQSLLNHLLFFVSAIVLIVLFLLLGIHKRVVAPNIITARTRTVLMDFNMSCDDTGKLLLKPRPTS